MLKRHVAVAEIRMRSFGKADRAPAIPASFGGKPRYQVTSVTSVTSAANSGASGTSTELPHHSRQET